MAEPREVEQELSEKRVTVSPLSTPPTEIVGVGSSPGESAGEERLRVWGAVDGAVAPELFSLELSVFSEESPEATDLSSAGVQEIKTEKRQVRTIRTVLFCSVLFC